VFHSPSAKFPGPGKYGTIDSISPSGKQFLSNWRSSLASVFHPVHSKRFSDIPKDLKLLPGPGHYNPKPSINDTGSYFISKFHSSLVRKFSISRRDSCPVRCSIAIIRYPRPWLIYSSI
jgi:hypothetical protein